MRTLIETYELLLESKKAEEILKNSNFTEEEIANIIGKLKADNNEQYLPMMVTVVSWGEKNYNTIKELFEDYNELFKNNNLGKIFASNGKITIKGKDGKDNELSNFIELTEFIDGVRDNVYKNKYGYSYEEYKAEDKPIQSSNGIDVYEADNVGKCIKYSQGRLTGRVYSFCIGKPANTMYQSYRDSKTSTFYFIVDRNKFVTNPDGSVNLDNPLHIVVYDVTRYGIQLTDINNTTGTIAEYGRDVKAYQNYLKSKGINIDQLKNRPKTSEEETEDEILGGKNESLEWFEQLSLDYKSKYIGRGHLLTDKQFNTIASNKQLLNQYANIGQALPYNQYIIIKKIPSAFNSYKRIRNIAVSNGSDLKDYEFALEWHEIPLEIVEKIKNMVESNNSNLNRFLMKLRVDEKSFINKYYNNLGRILNTKRLEDIAADFYEKESINLENKGISNFPIEITKNKKLNELNLQNNNISSIPIEISNLKNLEYLWLKNNSIQEIPSEISNLKKLILLDLGNNSIQEMPSEISNLKRLVELDLKNNNISFIPNDINKLKNLELLNLKGNLLPLEEINKVKKMLRTCDVIF